MNNLHIKNVLLCEKTPQQSAPLVLDSPHSGSIYPEDFRYNCPKAWLRETEDGLVDEIFSAAPKLGLPLLKAFIPRSYIDVNRAENDIDPKILQSPWPEQNKVSARSEAGIGLIRRIYKQRDPQPIYNRFLSVNEVRARIEKYYRPYHKTLADTLEDTHKAFGIVFHLNCHSMPLQDDLHFRGEIVLGDRDGTSCHSSFTHFVEECLTKMGYRVLINHPYKGVEILHRHGHPAQNRHSLQIEILRSLYMNEKTRGKTPGFKTTQQDMTSLLKQLVDFTTNFPKICD